jgi:hypothetical protein
MALAKKCSVAVLVFIHQILHIKSTNPLHILSRAVLPNLGQGKFRTRMVILLTAALHYYETCDSSYSNGLGKHQGFA